MKRVASLHLPGLSIERLRRTGRAPPPERPAQPVSRARSNPGVNEPDGPARIGTRIEDCSCPRGGGWRPGASWARRQVERQAEIDALPAHQRPPMRMLGRRSEPAAPLRFPGEKPNPSTDRGQIGAAPPLATTHRMGQRVVLAAVSPEAAGLGLHPGMPATQARVLAPALELRDAEPEADSAFLARLALFAARRWTPTAAVSAPDGLWLDLSGIAHLFGGEAALARRILMFCARLGLTARLAIAGTPGAAHALARFSGRPVAICRNGHEADALAGLPVAALRLDDAALSASRRFGIGQVGELLGMPRGPLARRFGRLTIDRIDQALGRIGEPFDPIVPSEPPRVQLRLLEPIGTAEAIAQVLSDLLARLVRCLEQEGLAVRRLRLVCQRVDGAEQAIEIGTVSATRDSAHLYHLLGLRIETIDPGFGIEMMELIALRCEPLRARQIGEAFGEADSPPELPPLIDRIGGRIGPGRLYRAGAVESDVPERSVQRAGPLDPVTGWPPHWPRPVRLLARPEPVQQVIAELPDQPPLRFSWRGQVHRVRKADGPERIHGEWWRRPHEAEAVRDYFQVEDEDGARFWLFRRGDGTDPRTGDLSWWMHGLFG